MKANYIVTSDTGKLLRVLPSCSVQCVFADPPPIKIPKGNWDDYREAAHDYLDWTQVWVSECMRILKDDGLLFCCGQLGKREHTFIFLMARLCELYQFHDLIIWDRAVGYNERRDSFTPAYEMILALRKSDKPKFRKAAVRESYDSKTIEMYLKDKRYKDKQARLNHLLAGKFATNIMRVPSLKGASKEKCGHPSQKPLELVSKFIACSTDPGDIVLDPFLGSGTTAVAAEKLGRQWIGIESNPMYVRVAQNRLAEARGLFTEAETVATPKQARVAK
jgi:DNA modification methylase